jgi:gentisate 1,2-dioxygenase
MIDLKAFFNGRDAAYRDELTDEIRRNAGETVAKANALLERAGFEHVCTVNSGWRPRRANAALPEAAATSRHLTGQAVDLPDPDRRLAAWCVNNLDLLAEIGLWMEDPRWTYDKGGGHWVHVQTVPPKSGRRVFVPSDAPPKDPAFPATRGMMVTSKEEGMKASAAQDTRTDTMDLFYEEVKGIHARALWQTAGPRKKSATVPYLWKYSDFRPLLFKAAEVVPIELAERRVLVMANPGILTDWQASSTLLANLQIILPGEVARSHRHAASALRLVIEGTGAYTAVDGEKTYMEPGDFVTTPNWTWHDHGNEGDGPMVWLDGLDIPLVQELEVNFYEMYGENKFPLSSPDDLSLRLHGAGSLRPTWVRHDAAHSPLLNYKFERTCAALKAMAERTDGSPYDGVSVEYVNPLTGGPAMATIACFASLLRAGLHTKAHRHTGGTICHVIKGSGRSVIGGKLFHWDEKDTFVVPSWTWHEHEATSESVLFSFSDSAALQALALYREEALADNGGYQRVEGEFAPLPVPERKVAAP